MPIAKCDGIKRDSPNGCIFFDLVLPLLDVYSVVVTISVTDMLPIGTNAVWIFVLALNLGERGHYNAPLNCRQSNADYVCVAVELTHTS